MAGEIDSKKLTAPSCYFVYGAPVTGLIQHDCDSQRNELVILRIVVGGACLQKACLIIMLRCALAVRCNFSINLAEN